MMIGILIAIVLLSARITELYAQTITPPVAAGPAEDIEIIDSETIRAKMFNFFGSTKLVDYKLYQDGRAIYVLEGVGSNGVMSNGNRTVEVHTTHDYTPAEGYTSNASGVFTPEGKKLLIETLG